VKEGRISSDTTADNSTQITASQFLIIYKFRPDPLLGNAQQSKPVELIGVITMKADKESFWVSPSHQSTEKHL